MSFNKFPESSGGGGVGSNVSAVTVTDETGTLVNSRELVDGTGTTIDTSTPGKIAVNASGGGDPDPAETDGVVIWDGSKTTTNTGLTADPITGALVAPKLNLTPDAGAGTILTVQAGPSTTYIQQWLGADGIANYGNITDLGAWYVPSLAIGANDKRATFNTSAVTTGGASIVIPDGLSNTVPNIATNRLLGNVSGSAGAPVELTPAQSISVITSASGGGTSNFLRADGSWAAPVAFSSGTDSANTTGKLYYNGDQMRYSGVQNLLGAVPASSMWPHTPYTVDSFTQSSYSGGWAQFYLGAQLSGTTQICAPNLATGAIYFASRSAVSKIAKYVPKQVSLSGLTPTSGTAVVNDMIFGPDANMWFTDSTHSKITKLDQNDAFTEYSTVTSSALPNALCVGPDGRIWGTYLKAATKIVFAITTGGTLTEYTPGLTLQPHGICAGSDGNIWVTEPTASGTNYVAKINTSGVLVAEYAIPTTNVNLLEIHAGPDGNLWAISNNSGSSNPKYYQITTSGTIKEFTLSGYAIQASASATLRNACFGPDGRLYVFAFVSGGISMLRINLDGTFSRFIIENLSTPGGARGYCPMVASDGSIWSGAAAGTSGVVFNINTSPVFNNGTAGLLPLPWGNINATQGINPGIAYSTNLTRYMVGDPAGTTSGRFYGLPYVQLTDSTFAAEQLLVMPSAGIATRPSTPLGAGIRYQTGAVNNVEFYDTQRISWFPLRSQCSANGSTSNVSGSFSSPSDLCVAADGITIWGTGVSNVMYLYNTLTEVTSSINVGFNTIVSCCLGPDGNIWATANAASNNIVKITPSGGLTFYTASTAPVASFVCNRQIIWGPDDNLWYITNTNKISKVTTSGSFTNYTTNISVARSLTHDGTDLWFSDSGNLSISKITTSGTVTQNTGASSGIRSILYQPLENALYCPAITASQGIYPVYKFTIGSAAVITLGSGTTGLAPACNGLVLGSDGYLYANCNGYGLMKFNGGGAPTFGGSQAPSTSTDAYPVNYSATGVNGIIIAPNGRIYTGGAGSNLYMTKFSCALSRESTLMPKIRRPGSTSGFFEFSMPAQGTNYKKFVVYCDAVTDSGITFTYPTPFTRTPAIVSNAGLTINTISNTSVTIPATSATTGFIILEGY